jgi:hypothetical protein
MSDQIIAGNLSVQGFIEAQTDAQIGGNLQVNGSGYVYGGLTVHGLSSFEGNVGIGTATPYSALTINGSLGFTNGTNPMMYIFERDTSNPDRPIIAHSPPYPDWGLAYRDTNDTMLFIGSSVPVLSISLGSHRVGIGTDDPTEALDVRGKIKSQNMRVMTQASNRIATWSTAWETVPDMALMVAVGENPLFVVFQAGGVQPSTPYQSAQLFYRLLIDNTPRTWSMNEFHNNGWELRDVSLSWLEQLPPGQHLIQVQWRTGNSSYQNNICWGENTRTLIAIEL